jgi:hypothetical protein
VVHHLQAIAVIEVEAAGVVAVGELGGLQNVGAFADDGIFGAKDSVVVGIDNFAGLGGAFRTLLSSWLLGRHALIGSIRSGEGSTLL